VRKLEKIYEVKRVDSDFLNRFEELYRKALAYSPFVKKVANPDIKEWNPGDPEPDDSLA
jgi:hypothetical protein